MNFPKQIRNIPENRRAVAPYNFVELPDQIIEVLKSDLPSHDRYDRDRLTGRIECTLTTESPLYIRCGLTPTDYATWGENSNEELTDREREIKANFFSLSGVKPVIPGSSLRGMMRSLVEIISYSKIEKVSENIPLFFRAVATTSKSDSLAETYKTGTVKAGYLVCKNGKWSIQPAKEINNISYAWIKERDCGSIPDLIKLNDSQYYPQYIPVRFESIYEDTKTRKKMVKDLGSKDSHQIKCGILVTSGNMKQNEDNATPRRNHCVVFERDENGSLMEINESLIKDYCKALTDFQKNIPFSKELGFLFDGRPVFYIKSGNEKQINKFGQSPNFRHPYVPQKSQQAARITDFLPTQLRCNSQLDLADAIFGFVGRISKRENENKDKAISRSGRIFFGDAIGHEDMSEMLMDRRAILSKTLLSPKVSTFQHYLVQTEGTQAQQNQLMHYGKVPVQDTVIRGHKLYWHKSKDYNIYHETPEDVTPEISTWIKPICPKKKFSFTIWFENLSKIELGALQWVIKKAADPKYRLSLGMGKPLGMGAIKIEASLFVKQCENHYRSLFCDTGNWQLSEHKLEEDFSHYFEDKMLAEIAKFNPEAQGKSFEEIDRIAMLLAMLSWDERPADNETRYLEVERVQEKGQIDGDSNEYKKRRVLPMPLQVIRSNTVKPSRPKKKVLIKKNKVDDLITATISSVKVDNGAKSKMTLRYIYDDSVLPGKDEIYNFEKKGINFKEGDEVKLIILAIYEDGDIKKYKLQID
jgi:CRISPR-associated protein (TIGR03986 family)